MELFRQEALDYDKIYKHQIINLILPFLCALRVLRGSKNYCGYIYPRPI
jgi:hypothetical protein